MAVSTELIATVSPYSVGATASATVMTEAMYNTYKTIAGSKLDEEDAGLAGSDYDYCHALLICHYFASSQGDSDYQSEKIGDYSYTRRSNGSISATIYLDLYNSILQNGVDLATTVFHNDTDMDEYNIDPNPIFEVDGE